MKKTSLLKHIIVSVLLKEPMSLRELKELTGLSHRSLKKILSQLINEKKILMKKIGNTVVYWTNPLVFHRELYIAGNLAKQLLTQNIGKIYSLYKAQGFSEKEIDTAIALHICMVETLDNIHQDVVFLILPFLELIRKDGFPLIVDYDTATEIVERLVGEKVELLIEKYPELLWVEPDRERGVSRAFLIINKPWKNRGEVYEHSRNS